MFDFSRVISIVIIKNLKVYIKIISDITLTVASNHIATAASNELKLERDIFISQYVLNLIDYLDQLVFCRGSFFLGNIFEVVHS